MRFGLMRLCFLILGKRGRFVSPEVLVEEYFDSVADHCVES